MKPRALAAGDFAGDDADNPGRAFGVVATRDLPDRPFEHLRRGLGMLVGAALDQRHRTRGEHRPVTVAFEIRDVQLHGGIECQTQREQP